MAGRAKRQVPTTDAPDEALLGRIRQALQAGTRQTRTPERLPLAVALSELEAWITDERQWQSAYAGNWKSLIADVERAITSCGPAARGALLAGNRDVLGEFAAARARIGSTAAPDPALRRRLQRIAAPMTTRLRSSSLLAPAFEDLRAAAVVSNPRAAEEAARQFLELATAGGRGTKLKDHVVAILADRAWEVASARGDKPTEPDPNATAGASSTERVDLVRRELEKPAATGQVVIWMDYGLARVGGPPIIMGEHVSVYDGGWLQAVLAADNVAELPPEAQSQPAYLRMLLDLPPSPGTGSAEEEAPTGDHSRETPVAYVRVDLGEIVVDEARALGLETAEAVVSLASLYGVSPSIWRPGEGWVVYVDGVEAGASFGSKPPAAVTVDEHLALARPDETAHTLNEVAELLGPHLPVRDPAVAEACRLLAWLRQARRAADPARLLLCDRVIEQVSGWAGTADRAYFHREYLRPAWTYRRIRSEIRTVGWDAQVALHRLGHPHDDTFQEIYPDGQGLMGPIDLGALLKHLPWLVQQLPADSDARLAAQELLGHTTTGKATLAHLKRLDDHFDVLEARARRTRNALVHGGPISADTVVAVVDFADDIAAYALNVSVQGRLAGHDLVDHFLDAREHLVRARRRLGAGEPAAKALFWEDTGGL